MARTAISFIHFVTVAFVLYLAALLLTGHTLSATGSVVLALAAVGANTVLTGLLTGTRGKARRAVAAVRKAVR